MTILTWRQLALANSIVKQNLNSVFISDNEFVEQLFPDASLQKKVLAIIMRKIIADDCRIKREQIAENCLVKNLEILMQDTTFFGWVWGGFLWNGYDYDSIRMRLWDYIDIIYGKRTPHILTSDKINYLLSFSQFETPEFTFGNWVRLVVQDVNRILHNNGICFSDERCKSFDVSLYLFHEVRLNNFAFRADKAPRELNIL